MNPCNVHACLLPGCRAAWRGLCLALLLASLGACSVRPFVVRSMADALATQSQAPEDDLVLAREASAFYLKLSESVLREAPDSLALAEAVATGFTQYSYAFVALEADRVEDRDAAAAQALRERSARLYGRAQRHAMAALERAQPGFRHALESPQPADWPRLRTEQLGLAYWAAAAWGGAISLSKDQPDVVADLPLAQRLAEIAYAQDPAYGDGALASLLGSFAAARGAQAQALQYFDQAITMAGTRNAGPLLAKAEGLALPTGDRAAFDALLQQALAVAAGHSDLQNNVLRERARWLLAHADDLF